jgi:predicted AAA+ superfamily ATPase
MQRFLLEQLKAWRVSPGRKPLVLRGARQVGKTWLLQEFGKQSFENVAYVRLEDNDAMARLFAGSLEPERILRGIAAETGEHINPQTTLIVLDEVQAVPRALTSLKYFYEECPEYAIAVAGSLLGVSLNAGVSFPVGKVTFEDLYPLSFREFLLAMGQDTLEQALRECDFDLIGIYRERYIDLLKTYYFVGGMPEAVARFAETGDDFAGARQVQRDILLAYQGDFAKHAGAVVGERCRLVFESLPRHLAKENKKFTYGTVKKGARGRDLDDALQFLADAGLVTKVSRVSKPGVPLSSYVDESAFKLFCVDIGLLGALADIDSKTIIEGNALFTHFKGAMAEQYVCQQLVSDNGLRPYYWSAPKSSGEIDFIVQAEGNVVPIEVKAEENLRSKSLASFCKANKLDNAVRLSLSGYREESWMTNIPLYAMHCLTARSDSKA